MADKLPDDEIEKIVDLYEEIGSYKGVAEREDTAVSSPTTVKKYVERNKSEGVEEETSPGETPDGFTAPPPNGVMENQGEREDIDLSELDYDEFIEYFFTTRGHGVSTNWMKNLMVQCDLRDQIPDKDQLLEMMQRGACGLGSSGDQEVVADNYWAVAERYLQAKREKNARRGPGGEWVGPSISQTQGNGQSGGSWLGMSHQQQPNGYQQNPQAQGQGQPQPQSPQFNSGGYQQQNTQGMMNQQQNQQQPNSETEELREALQDIQQTQVQIAQALSNNQNNNLKSQVQELAEVQSTVQQLQASGSNQEVQAVKQQLASLQQQIAESQSSNNSGNGMESLIRLASEGDVDPDTLGTLAGVMGVTDPEVKKEEYKMMREERKLENRKELLDSAMDGLQDLGGGILSSAFQSMGDDGDQNDGGMNQNNNVGGAGAGTGTGAGANAGNNGVVEPVEQQQPTQPQDIRPPNDYRNQNNSNGLNQQDGGVDLGEMGEDDEAEVLTPDNLDTGDEEEGETDE